MQQRDADAAPSAIWLFVPGTTPRPRSTESEATILLCLGATRGVLLCAF